MLNDKKSASLNVFIITRAQTTVCIVRGLTLNVEVAYLDQPTGPASSVGFSRCKNALINTVSLFKSSLSICTAL